MAKKRASKKGKKRAARKKASGGIEVDHLFIGTSNFDTSWKFWTEVVGLKGEAKWGKPEYAGTLGAGRASITIAQGEEGPYDELGYNVMNGRPQLYLRAPNVDRLHAAVVKRGAKVVRPPITTHYGARVFSIEGPDGTVVVFTESK